MQFVSIHSRWLAFAGACWFLWAGAAWGEERSDAPALEETPMDTLIAEIQSDARRTADYTGVAHISPLVVEALRATPRERFVPTRARSLAYANHPLPIGHGQTISQPFIVAIMTEMLAVQPDHRVLEIGTGSGYQAAVLAHLAAEVYTVEIVPALAASAEQRLADLGYGNVHVRASDGWHGWPEHAPFDSVIVTAVGERIPEALIDQLAENGRLVMPLEQPRGYQELVVYSKAHDETRALFPVRFVPLTGGPDATKPEASSPEDY